MATRRRYLRRRLTFAYKDLDRAGQLIYATAKELQEAGVETGEKLEVIAEAVAVAVDALERVLEEY